MLHSLNKLHASHPLLRLLLCLKYDLFHSFLLMIYFVLKCLQVRLEICSLYHLLELIQPIFLVMAYPLFCKELLHLSPPSYLPFFELPSFIFIIPCICFHLVFWLYFKNFQWGSFKFCAATKNGWWDDCLAYEWYMELAIFTSRKNDNWLLLDGYIPSKWVLTNRLTVSKPYLVTIGYTQVYDLDYGSTL